jgi:hypothetical protein
MRDEGREKTSDRRSISRNDWQSQQQSDRIGAAIKLREWGEGLQPSVVLDFGGGPPSRSAAISLLRLLTGAAKTSGSYLKALRARLANSAHAPNATHVSYLKAGKCDACVVFDSAACSVKAAGFFAKPCYVYSPWETSTPRFGARPNAMPSRRWCRVRDAGSATRSLTRRAGWRRRGSGRVSTAAAPVGRRPGATGTASDRLGQSKT